MATIVDNEEGRYNSAPDGVEQPEHTLEDSVAPVQAEQAPEETTPSVPDKYQGKSVADIVKMHQEAEQLLGRQSSEVGELRKVVDEFVMSQSNTEAKGEEEEIDYVMEFVMNNCGVEFGACVGDAECHHVFFSGEHGDLYGTFFTPPPLTL